MFAGADPDADLVRAVPVTVGLDRSLSAELPVDPGPDRARSAVGVAGPTGGRHVHPAEDDADLDGSGPAEDHDLYDAFVVRRDDDGAAGGDVFVHLGHHA